MDTTIVEKKPESQSYKTIGMGVAAALAAVWGYMWMSSSSPSASSSSSPSSPSASSSSPSSSPSSVPALTNEDKEQNIFANAKYLAKDHPMFKNMQEIRDRIYRNDRWQVQEFEKAVKMLDAFESLLSTCMEKSHSETMKYPEYAYNIRRDFADVMDGIAQVQRKEDTVARANITLEYADMVKTWMKDNISNLNAMNDEKVAKSLVGA